MPTYGPWETPPTSTATATLPPEATVFVRWLSHSTTSFADACEVLGGPGTGTLQTLSMIGGAGPDWFISQTPMAIMVDDLATSMSDYTPTLPSHATGVDYDPTDPASPDWLVGPTVTATLHLTRDPAGFFGLNDAQDNADWPIIARQLNPATLTATDPWPPAGWTFGPADIYHWPDQLNTFYPGMSLNALTSLATVHLPNVGTGTAGETIFDANIAVPLAAFADVAGHRQAGLVLHFASQVSHLDPGGVVSVQLGTPGVSSNAEGVAVDVTFTYQPRRYRFVYSTLPRLRQFPRDDFLGGAPRQGKTNGATSVQGSTRQGWRGTYR